MELTVLPGPLQGTVAAVPSKSAAHRLLILAAMADRPTGIALRGDLGDDLERTISCLQAMGAGVERSGESVRVTPPAAALPSPRLHCGESGSTLRFLLPVAAALCGGGHFSGSGRLPERPLGELLAALERGGITFSGERLPFTMSGRLRAGEYRLPGDVSSQYVSGLLLALPALPGESAIRLSGRLESSAYVEMTREALRSFSLVAHPTATGFTVPGAQRCLSPGEVRVEGDWSNAAFFLAAGALGGPVTVTGLEPASRQGDRAVAPLLERFGARVRVTGRGITVSRGELRGVDLDLRQIPDLLPALAVVAAAASGTTRFSGGARLRFKESDRIASTAAMIGALGGRAAALPDGLVVHGGALGGGTVDSFGDHRIAMAAAVAAAGAAGAVTVVRAGAVSKSYPAFFADHQRLGGRVDGI